MCNVKFQIIALFFNCILWKIILAKDDNQTDTVNVDNLVRAVVNDDVKFQPALRPVSVNESDDEGVVQGTLAQSTEFDYISPRCMNESVAIRQFKISGSQFSESERWPYLVSLQMEIAPNWYRHFCAGVLVSQMAVLTTAHCIKLFRSDLNSDFGSLSVPIYASFAPQCRHMQGQHNRVLINSYRVHHKYRSDRVGYDIAVLKLEVAANETIEPVDFRTSKSFRRIDQYKKLHVVGWGSINIQDHSKKRFNRRVEPLHHATLEAYNYNACQKDLMRSGAIGVTLDEKTMMCAYSIQSDTCEGDSGGPLLVSDLLGDPKYDILVGLTSFGPDIVCGGSLYLPGVYTKISFFVRWIEESIKELKATDSDAENSQTNDAQDGPLPYVKFDADIIDEISSSSSPSPFHSPNHNHSPSLSPSPIIAEKVTQKHYGNDVILSEIDPQNQQDVDLDTSVENFEERKQQYLQECMVMARIMGTSLSDCV